MKQLFFSLVFSTILTATFAQKYIPVIKTGSVLNFSIYLKNMGQNADLNLTVTSLKDPITLHWNVPGYGGGEFEMPVKSLENAKKTVLSPPAPDGVTKINTDETLMVLSKALYAEATNTKAFELNSIKYTIIPDTAVYKINDKVTDIFHAVSADKKSEIWVLNSPDYPIICQARGVTKGIDFYLTSVKE